MLEDVMQDEKVQKVLTMLAEGKTRKEIADSYNQGWNAIDMYMRRKGFSWDKEGQTYIIKQEKEPKLAIEQAVTQNTKAAQIVRMLDVKHPNFRQTASKQGFESVEEMGVYMKSHGYVWDNELNNYRYEEFMKPIKESHIPTTTISSLHGEMDKTSLIQFLLMNQQKLVDLLQMKNDGSLPTYKFKGTKVGKTLGIASTVDALLSDYSKEYNITQRQILETALAEFFQKYGYEQQLQQAIT